MKLSSKTLAQTMGLTTSINKKKKANKQKYGTWFFPMLLRTITALH